MREAQTNRFVLTALCATHALAVGAVADAPGAAHRRAADVIGGYASTHIVVRISTDAGARFVRFGRRKGRVPLGDPRPALSRAFDREATAWGATGMRPFHADAFSDASLARKHGLDRVFILDVPAGTDTPAMARAMSRFSEDVESAFVDVIGTTAEFIPDDTSFPLQWGMRNYGQTSGIRGADIDASAAWDLHTGEKGTVTIAIIDSGVDSHVDYGTNAAPFPNGRFVQGANTAATGTAITDDCNHGTHVAGIAAATGNNDQGVAGVTWGANIMSVRVTESSGFPCISVGCCGISSSLASGIVWAADNGAHVANMSLQYNLTSASQIRFLQDAANYAHDLGVVLVAAAGNQDFCGSGVVCYPGRLRHTIAVTATTDDDLFADRATTFGWRSNWGPEVDVSAPGDRIYSTYVDPFTNIEGYRYLDGTSMAAPHVAGLAALLKSYVPELTNVDIADILMTTGKDLGTAGWDDKHGYGRINAYRALLAAEVWPTIVSSIPTNHAVDARQRRDSNGFFTFGWDSVEMTFPADVVAGLTVDSFTLMQKGGDTSPPSISDVVILDAETVRVQLDSRIALRGWTTIAHEDTGIVRIGFLPGDVTGNGTSNVDDVVALMDVISGMGDPLPEWSTDLDRSGGTSPIDILTGLNLLNGADVYIKWLDETLLP